MHSYLDHLCLCLLQTVLDCKHRIMQVFPLFLPLIKVFLKLRDNTLALTWWAGQLLHLGLELKEEMFIFTYLYLDSGIYRVLSDTYLEMKIHCDWNIFSGSKWQVILRLFTSICLLRFFSLYCLVQNMLSSL